MSSSQNRTGEAASAEQAKEAARLREVVREGYARIAEAAAAGGGAAGGLPAGGAAAEPAPAAAAAPKSGGCCGSGAPVREKEVASKRGSPASPCCGPGAPAHDDAAAAHAAAHAGPCCGGAVSAEPAAGAGARETGGGSGSCCGAGDVDQFAQALGYAPEELASLPPGTNLGLSCGNPTALASLRPGEVVVDLGSGAGLDVLIAARKIGPEGRAIGVDMTPQMLANARRNAAAAGAANAEFRLGEIENLPVADGSVDVVISNCVINLSPDKPRVFQEIARVLRPGGRVAVSDLALLRPLPEAVREDMAAYVGCVAGAVLLDEYVGHMRGAGLVEIEVEPANPGAGLGSVQDHLYQRILSKLPSGTRPEDFVASVRVQARKPEA